MPRLGAFASVIVLQYYRGEGPGARWGGVLTPDTPTPPRVGGPQGGGTHRPAWSPGGGRRGAAPGAPRPPPPGASVSIT